MFQNIFCTCYQLLKGNSRTGRVAEAKPIEREYIRGCSEIKKYNQRIEEKPEVSSYKDTLIGVKMVMVACNYLETLLTEEQAGLIKNRLFEIID